MKSTDSECPMKWITREQVLGWMASPKCLCICKVLNLLFVKIFHIWVDKVVEAIETIINILWFSVSILFQ